MDPGSIITIVTTVISGGLTLLGWRKEYRTRRLKLKNTRVEPVEVTLTYYTEGVDKKWAWSTPVVYTMRSRQEAFLTHNGTDVHAQRIKIAFKGIRSNARAPETEYVSCEQEYTAFNREVYVFTMS